MNSTLRAQFLRFDDRLASLGVPPCSEWWRDGIGHWLDAYESGGALELWACVGRGAAKSTALYKLALFFTLFGDFSIPVGERHYAIVLSRLKEEAAKGIEIIAHWLVLLDVPHKVVGDVIELVDDPTRGIRVVAASVSATSGWRAYAVFKDERSKWPSGGVDDTDADEVDTSAAAMTSSHPNAISVAAGSAWVAAGPFYNAITSGTDATKVVLGPAPTWVAAPHISEEDLRRKIRDPRRFAREFRSEFVAGVSAVYPVDDVDAAIAHPRYDGLRLRRHLIIDASSGRKDAFTFAVAGWVVPGSGQDWRPYIEIVLADEVPNSVMETEGAKAVIARIAAIAKAHSVGEVHGDQREAPFIRDALSDHDLTFRQHDWTSQSKPNAVQRVVTWFRERSIALPKTPVKLRTELINFEEKIAPSGQYTYSGRNNGHDDYVALLVTAAMAQLEGSLSCEERGDSTLYIIYGDRDPGGRRLLECSGGTRRRIA